MRRSQINFNDKSISDDISSKKEIVSAKSEIYRGSRSKSSSLLHEYNSPLFYGNLIVAKQMKIKRNLSDNGTVINQLSTPLKKKVARKEELCIA